MTLDIEQMAIKTDSTPVRLLRSGTFRPVDGIDYIPLFPREDLSIGLARVLEQDNSRYHAHEFIELAIIEDGNAVQLYEQNEFTVSRGDVFVILPERPHTLSKTQNLKISNVLFLDDGSIPMLSELSRRPGYRAMFDLEPQLREDDVPQRRLKLDHKQLGTVISLLTRIESALHSGNSGGAIATTIHFLELITFLCEAYENVSSSGGRVLTQLSQAASYIEDNFADDIQVDELAKVANMSLRSFQRHFQHVYKVTPTRFVHKRRLSEARKLLRTTDSAVSDVAFEVGFNDVAYFSRAFRKETGLPPKRYQLEARRP